MNPSVGIIVVVSVLATLSLSFLITAIWRETERYISKDSHRRQIERDLETARRALSQARSAIGYHRQAHKPLIDALNAADEYISALPSRYNIPDRKHVYSLIDAARKSVQDAEPKRERTAAAYIASHEPRESDFVNLEREMKATMSERQVERVLP